MFLTMFFKTQNIGQTMHLTMLIAHPYWATGVDSHQTIWNVNFDQLKLIISTWGAWKLRKSHQFQRRFVWIGFRWTDMNTTTTPAWNHCYSPKSIFLFVSRRLVFTCVLCRQCLVLACHHRKVHKQDGAAGHWHPFFTAVGDLLIYFQDNFTFAFSLGRAHI